MQKVGKDEIELQRRLAVAKIETMLLEWLLVAQETLRVDDIAKLIIKHAQFLKEEK